jgi:nucleotide-binding universal stress UspA family protein
MTVNAVGIERVVVGVSGSLGNLAALHVAAGEARRSNVPLAAVLSWVPTGGELAYHRSPWKPLLDLYRQHAVDTLVGAFRDAFGGSLTDVDVTLMAVRGYPGESLLRVANRPGDLLVVGTGRRGRTARLWHGAVARFCLANAQVCVLTVPPPAMIKQLNPRRRHLRSRELTQLTSARG